MGVTGRRPAWRLRWRRAAVPVVVAFAAGCSDSPRVPSAPTGVELADGSLPPCASPVPVRMDTVAVGLEVPWDMTFLPDGTALVTERPGRILRIDQDPGGEPEPWVEFPVHAVDEVGLMGIDHQVLDDGTVEVFASATRYRDEPSWAPGPFRGLLRRLTRVRDPERGHVITLQVLRIPMGPGGEAGAPGAVVEDLPSGGIHGGGTVRVGPEGRIWLTSGDAGDPAQAQRRETTRGKLLRYGADGETAGLEAGSAVVARGLRHSQGMDWRPSTGELYLIDHGPTGMEAEDGRTGNDELNRVTVGANLGWPWFAGLTRGDGVVSPLVEWTPAAAPAGMRFYRGDEPAWQGSLFVTSLTSGSVRRIAMDVDGVPLCEEVMRLGLGRLRAVGSAPDGSLWVGTSNRDGRGSARAGDDVLVRLRPDPEATGPASPTPTSSRPTR